MPRLPLQTLPAFRLVAQRGSVRAAAEDLHLTHSAVSQQLRHLEEQVGFEVFERRARRLRLNPAGQALLDAVAPALEQLEEGLRTAAAVAGGGVQQIRLTLVPSFAQRWLLPRMARWRERHPHIALDLHTSQELVDLTAQGFHAALRQGRGGWRGLRGERLIDSPLIVVGSAAAARRLLGQAPQALAREPLLGSADVWARWFAHAGLEAQALPVAVFNDAGLMLQACEQDLGIALARELLAADALRTGALVRLSPVALAGETADRYWLLYPPSLATWEPLHALHRWLRDELAQSWRELGHEP